VTSSTGSAPERPLLSSRWMQPGPPRTDENLKHVHRKIDPKLKTADHQDDFLAKAWAERMAKQWEDVTARLLRDFAPAGGADADVVLQHIEEQRREPDSATVRDYLPVLVDKAVRCLLAPEETPPA
jgi:hypothetical protein